MKLGILIDRLNVGGVEKIALEEVKALRALGEDASLLVLRKKGVVDNAFPELQKHVPIIFLDERLPRLLRFSFQFPIFHFFSSFHLTYPIFIPFLVKKKEFDYLIVHGTYTSFTAITIKWFRKIPFSAFIWDPISYIINRVYSKTLPSTIGKALNFIAEIVDKFILNATDYILTGGDAHNSVFLKLNHSKKIIKIVPGVHPVNNLNRQQKKDYILMVTAWKKGKNPEYIFKLIDKIPNLKFKLVGKWIDPKYEKEFRNKVKVNKYSKNIEILGEVTEKTLHVYYQEALFLLQTNDDRGFGMPALEAAAHGTTFIIPKGQGVCAIFKDGVDGFYTAEKDNKKLSIFIKKLINDKTRSLTMGEHALRTVENKYSWRIHSSQLMRLINKFL